MTNCSNCGLKIKGARYARQELMLKPKWAWKTRQVYCEKCVKIKEAKI